MKGSFATFFVLALSATSVLAAEQHAGKEAHGSTAPAAKGAATQAKPVTANAAAPASKEAKAKSSASNVRLGSAAIVAALCMVVATSL
ncbi:hypothetical protein TWF694_001469 [Orbilia ellipsospora]|uniref:Uncharacterized protein n=1 Tax=Orbilia ellipsospora TaxID=2528407 RepID=A0AAV9XS54_9PEZI